MSGSCDYCGEPCDGAICWDCNDYFDDRENMNGPSITVEGRVLEKDSAEYEAYLQAAVDVEKGR